jgi:replicative DNA helicase
LETLSKKYGVTILFSHHTSKDTAGVISQNMSRGSSAIVDGCRWQAGLVRMDAKTAERFCVENPRDYVLFDAPKSNYAADLPAAICFKRGESGVLEYCEPGCEIRNEMAEALLEMLTNDTTKYSRRDLIDQVMGRDVARDMKAKFPGFVRSKDMKNTIDHLMKTKRLFEVASGTDGAGKPKMVLSASPF